MILYSLYDWQQAMLAPWRFAAEATRTACSNPLFPLSYTEIGRALVAMADALDRAGRITRNKPTFGIEQIFFRGMPLRIKEEVVFHAPFCNLVHFRRETDDEGLAARIADDPRLLVVAPCAGHFATLLRDTVEALLPEHDLYITDWQDAKMVPMGEGPFDLEDAIEILMDQMRNLAPHLHVIGISQGGLMAFCATALLAEGKRSQQPCSLTLMGAPIKADGRQTALGQLAVKQDLDWFRDNLIQTVPFYYPGACRLVCPGFLQFRTLLFPTPACQAQDPASLFKSLIRGNGSCLAKNDRLYEEYLTVMDLSAPFYLQSIMRVFQTLDLPRGAFEVKGRLVRPAMIESTALLTVEGETDEIAPPGFTSAAHDLCTSLAPSQRAMHLEIGAGHYALFDGRQWRNNIRPVIQTFIRAHHPRGIEDEAKIV